MAPLRGTMGSLRNGSFPSTSSALALPKPGQAHLPFSTISSSSSRLMGGLRPTSALLARLAPGQGLAGPAPRPHPALRPFSVAAAAAAPAKAGRALPQVGSVQHGFKLERAQFVKEYDSHVLLYRHEKTGAELISVLNSDENKTFGVVFRTPVDDSTGIPHILEHSVLCGSRKYPLKEPFVELMKSSLNTFLNAFTYPDRTCYPVASTNLKDFNNLVDVYLDAVFHPRCVRDKRVFEQEGWHYELEEDKAPLVYKGVVFNEMKGVYSSPDSCYYRQLQRALFPDNTYRHDSGGDPRSIPDLSFEQFQAFHAKYYHPSNARIWFYGDDEPEQRLKLLNDYLSEFEAKKVDSAIATQALLPSPRKVVGYYAAGQEDGEEGLEGAAAEEGEAAPGSGQPSKGKAYVGVSWVLSDQRLDVETELGLGFLDYLMMGTPAAPLRKALNDSGLGTAVIGGGIDDDLKQPTCTLGLKGVDPANADKLEALILAKLEELAQPGGFSPSAIEAAVNTIEFSLRENNTGSFPRGLSLMLRALGAWVYGEDPFRPIQWENALAAFKARLASGEDVFSPLIRRYLLANPHRVTLTMLPDPGLGQKLEEEEAGRLAAAREGMSQEQVQAVMSNTSALKAMQEAADPPEALACIPALTLQDIPRTVTRVPTDVERREGATLLRHDLFTNDILYMEVGLDLSHVPAPLLPLLPLFCRSLTNMATAKESFVELTERIGRKTGGLAVYPFTTPVRGKEDPAAYVMVRGKAMSSKAGDLLELVRDVLLTARLDDQARFLQMVHETRAGLESAFQSSGHSFAARRLAAQRGVAGWLGEALGGLAYLDFIRGLARRAEAEWPAVQADLEAIRRALLQRSGAIVNLTADASTLSAAERPVSDFLAALPASSGGACQLGGWRGGLLPRANEALTVPTQVSYVAKAANLYEDGGYQLSGSAYVVEKYLGNTWLWDKVRVVGGAYGGFCSFDNQSGLFTYLSYRDPNLTDTLAAYDASPDFLRGLSLTKDELTKAIIGTIGDVDAYQLPDAKGYSQLSRFILGISDEERQQRREEILATSMKDFKAFADALECVRGPAARVAVVTSADKAKAVLEGQPGFWDIKKVI